jgi:hypothetical protein
VDPAPLFHFAAAFEFYMFALTFVVCVCLLSLAAARFVIGTVISHTFPRWRMWIDTATRQFIRRA